MSEVIRPGDRVVDLGCGPATQLAMIARLNPDVQFIGVDLSQEMLERANTHISEQGLSNVRFEQCDITKLSSFGDDSVDAVMSTVVLHHLPDTKALAKTFSEVRRILKPDGGLYLVDFGHLKSEKSIQTFAYQYADRQAELFTLDYLYSLQAAFDVNDFKRLAEEYLADYGRLHSTFGMPFMVAIKSTKKAELNERLIENMKKLREAMPDYHHKDLADLMTFFSLGGL